MTYTAAEINAVIAAGQTVIAQSCDLPRRGQPTHRAEVIVTEAFDSPRGIRVSARGYTGRFAARILSGLVGRDDR